MEMHRKCSCKDWRVYPGKYKLATMFVSTLLLAVVAGVVFVGWKLAGDIEALKNNPSLSTPWVKEALGALVGLVVFSLYALFVYKLPKHFSSWGKSICPKCEKGYIVRRGVNAVKAVFYFADNFLFREILVPMFRTITFQHFWRSGYKTSKGFISKFFTFILQIFLFFGAIPFLIFLLGQDNIVGLVCAIAVLLYIMYTIVARRKSEDLDYQKSVVLLMIPLYYVSMVELFRWAFLFSPEAVILVPDRSDFLFLGIQNFIRTQLFLDLLDAVNVVNLEVSGYLFLGATFLTRLLLDIAVISLLIKAGVESYRRTWIYYHTGRQVQDVTSKEALFDLENLVVVGNPSKIEEVRQKLSEVMRVLGLVKPYAENVHQMDDSESRIQAQECLNQLSGIHTELQTEKSSASTSWLGNGLSVVFVALWGFAFVLGIQYFIDEIIKIEIKELMEKAETQAFQQDPIGRQQLFDRVLQKDPSHEEAMLKSSDNYLKLAELNERVYSYQQAQVDIDNAFKYLRKIDRDTAKIEVNLNQADKGKLEEKRQKLVDKSAKAYTIRGRLFFLQNDMERALEELRKRPTQDTSRMLFDIQLYNASSYLFTPQAPEYFALASQELGFDLEYEFLYIQTLLQSIHSAYKKDFLEFITQLQPIVEQKPQSFNELYPAFANALAHALVRQGEKNYAAASKLFKEVYSNEAYTGKAKYSALLGMANMYNLRGQFADAKIILDRLLEDANAPQLEKKIALLVKATASLQLNEKEQAHKNIQTIISGYTDIRDRYRKQLSNYITGQLSADELLDEAQSWNIGISEKQHTLCYYYLGMMKLVEKRYDDAAIFLRRCVQLNLNSMPEVIQAKQELENLQIRFEGKSYQSELFFNDVYLSHLNKLTREQIKNKINPQHKTIAALEFLLSTKYDREKVAALTSIASHGSLSDDEFLQLITKALQEEDADLKIAALENLKVLPREASLKIKDAVVAELDNDNELVRRNAVKVLSVLREVEPLIAALQNEDEYIRRDAGYALAKMKTDATPAAEALEKALDDDQITVRDASFAAVAVIEAQAAVPILQRLVANTQHKDTELRIKALRRIASNHPQAYLEMKDSVTPTLVNILMKGSNEQSSRWAAMQLIRIGAGDDVLEANEVRPMVKKRLLELVKANDPQTRLAAASWFLHFHERWNDDVTPAVDVFMSRLKNGTQLEQQAVAEILLKEDRVSTGAAVVLDRALRSKDNDMINLAKKIYVDNVISTDFEHKIQKGFVESLVKLISDNHPVRPMATAILTKYKSDDPEGVVPSLLPLLLTDNAFVRENLLEILDLESGDYNATQSDADILVSGLDQSLEIKKLVLQISQSYGVSHEKMYAVCMSLIDNEDFAISASAIRILANFPDRKDEIMAKLLPILEKETEDPYGDDDEGDDDDGDDDEDYGDDDEDDTDDDEGDDDEDADDDEDYGDDDDDDADDDEGDDEDADDDEDYGDDDDDDADDDEGDDEEDADDDEDYGDDDDDDDADDDEGDDEEDDADDDEGDDDEDADDDEDYGDDDEDDADDDEGDDEEDDEEDDEDDEEDDEDDEEDDEDDEEDDEDEATEETKQEAALYTVAVFNGFDYLHNMATRYPHLTESAIFIAFEVQEKLELEDADAMLYISKFFTSDDEDIVLTALGEIEAVEGERQAALTGLKTLQNSDNVEIRKLAQKLVLDIEGSGDINLIIKWLDDEDEEIRLIAIKALSNTKIKSQSVVRKLAQKLTDESEDVRNKAEEVLVKLGKPAVPEVFKYTTHPKPQVRTVAMDTLGKMGKVAHAATVKLMQQLRKSPPQMHSMILTTVSKIATPKERRYVLKPCKYILSNKKFTADQKVLAWVIVAQVGLKTKAVDSLIALLETKPENQFFIIKNLQEIDAAYTVQYLKQVIRRRYGSINVVSAIRILELLKQDAKSAIPVLREMAIDPNPEFSAAAKKALTVIDQ
ncbi:HEAT repeat domain-containing protein [Candidatus Uabimicrobium amorphum]|nr:HEAT repeat domain-containing protein [Candidatus Uabimicrobium amorphum]